ncbi:cytochrome c oxidase subunit 2A [Ferdinandcohnia quinoae]|uniref:Cytochrome c oxidase subunit 2A n=1 Tax=Fredinandcohnia quinoae TaxID=2918902 RepID=A0AAW5EBJ7_9BACI|nr:cytochrome c oxidase subunit 2A [Fredinandcohnia sp. SECRCQ15]MCH1627342.1 cytochrome c oxidase subunit 2A [Fredinandcohnia sp. SECRCQ15]
MPKTELTKTKTKSKVEDDHSSLKGTLASVFILGAFLIVSWLGVYFLFLDRL